MTQDEMDPPDLLAFVVEATREIEGLGRESELQFCRALHRLSSHVARVDAFYVCFVPESADNLHFAYNYDNGRCVEPTTIHLAKGPTSWVVRQQRAYILDNQNAAIQERDINFGNRPKRPRSAVHVPMMATGHDGKRCLMGVLSAQSYAADAYSDEVVIALQWLAAMAARKLLHGREIDLHQREAQHARSSVVRMARDVTQLRRRIETQTNGLSELLAQLSADHQPLLEKVIEDLRRACCAARVQADLLPKRSVTRHRSRRSLPRASPLDQPELAWNERLTSRECEVLQQLIGGGSNREIAQKLFCSEDTVKFHLKKIFRKMGVGCRAGAVLAFRQSMKKTTPSHRKTGLPPIIRYI